ncbi:hypothetical protein TeGR_g8019, partial [Tetraparma gracilis]
PSAMSGKSGPSAMGMGMGMGMGMYGVVPPSVLCSDAVGDVVLPALSSKCVNREDPSARLDCAYVGERSWCGFELDIFSYMARQADFPSVPLLYVSSHSQGEGFDFCRLSDDVKTYDIDVTFTATELQSACCATCSNLD